ncbi:MAG TPA: site-2 protease family protein [Anaerolineales bacterium]|nr:site-2 protease family protein [Anaerolineales bacterium]
MTIPDNELLPIVSQIMAVADTTQRGESERGEKYDWRFRGQLLAPSESAFAVLEREFAKFGYLPLLRQVNNQQVIYAVSTVESKAPRVWLNIVLFVATVFSVLFMGAWNDLLYFEQIPPTLLSDSASMLERNGYVLTHLWLGWQYALALLAILLAHEFGHYFASRFHRSPATLPYFIPLPLPVEFNFLGTMGAVIQMHRPARNRKTLFDIGAAGPWAGFVVALVVLWIGIALSRTTIIPAEGGVAMEGNPLIYLLLKYWVHGQLLPQPASYTLPPALHWLMYWLTSTPAPYGALDIQMHPVAWAGWAGLLVTAMNLIPIGQLDGGHAIFVLFGKRARWIGMGAIGLLVLLGFIYSGWWLWAGLSYYVIGLRNSPLLDEITPLDGKRRILAWATILLFILVFTPIPLRIY